MRWMISSLMVAACAGLMCCGGKQEKESAAAQVEAVAADSITTKAMAAEATAVYSLQIIAAPENTFGYDILKDNKPFIHQPHVPGMPGIKGFAKETQARKAAEVMIEKLNNNIVPPTISEEELKAILSN